jgi:hypothetical protein
MFATVELLLTCGLIPAENEIMDAFLGHITKSKSPKKILLGIKVLAGFASLFETGPSENSRKAMQCLNGYLLHSYPKVHFN